MTKNIRILAILLFFSNLQNLLYAANTFSADGLRIKATKVQNKEKILREENLAKERSFTEKKNRQESIKGKMESYPLIELCKNRVESAADKGHMSCMCFAGSNEWSEANIKKYFQKNEFQIIGIGHGLELCPKEKYEPRRIVEIGWSRESNSANKLPEKKVWGLHLDERFCLDTPTGCLNLNEYSTCRGCDFFYDI